MSAHADHSSSDEGVDDENSSSDEDFATMEAAFSDDSGSGSEDEEEDDHRLPGPRSHVTWDNIIEPISFEPISFAEVRRVLQTVSVTILITIIICALMHLISQCELDDRISDALAGLTQDGARFTTGQN